MNLRAKGFYLDNAEEMSARELRERDEHLARIREIKKRQSELLAVLENAEAEEALEAAELLKELSQQIEGTMTLEEQKELKTQRHKKLRALQNRLQSNSDMTFAGFKGELDGIKRPTRKMQILTDRLQKEEMYFNPVLSKLG